MKMITSSLLVILIMTTLIYSCGKSETKSENQNQNQKKTDDLDANSIDGLYRATFETLNPHINGTIPGSLTFLREEDKIIAYVRIFAGGPRAWHQQGVYLGRRCPSALDDTNKDGIIDIAEAMEVVGKMIIPLDANINSQNAGRNLYPLGDLSGYYHYERFSSFKRLFEDLRDEDLDSDDHITKLNEDDRFSFENRIVMVQGVTEETVLPESVAGLGHRRPFQTLPITCGIIKKVNDTPGSSYDGEIPGPIGDVVDGQDQPSPPDETTGGTAGTTVAGTTGSNEDDTSEVGDHSGSAGGNSTGGRSTTGGTTTGEETTGGFIGGSDAGNTSGGTQGN